MTKDSYMVTTVTCEKSGCDTTFGVVVSPIQTVVTTPTEDLANVLIAKGIREALPLGDENSHQVFDNYIVVNCPCGEQKQRVYLKEGKHG